MVLKTEGEVEKKPKFSGEIQCPHCGFFLDVEAGKTVIKPAVKAETEDYIDVKVSSQSRLETGDEPETKKEKKKGKKKK